MTRHDPLRTRLALFFVAAATLMLELLLTRVFDVILTPNMAYMVIACALFSFGLAGVYVTLRSGGPSESGDGQLSMLALLFSVTTLTLLPALNLLPFDYEAISEQPFVQVLAFLAMYLALVVPFFLSGLIFTRLFSSRARSIQALYFWDLSGAAVGCVLMVPLLQPIGPGGILFVTAAFALVASGLFAQRRRLLATAAATAVLLVLVPCLRSPRYFEFTEHLAKRGVKDARLAGTIEFSRWDPVSKIDVIEQAEVDPTTGRADPATRRKHIAYDGGTQSSHIFPFDGNLRRLRESIEAGTEPVRRHFWHRGVLASHYARRDSRQRVLVIGSAGGQETKAALMYGAARVDAVEMVGSVIEIVTGRYAAYAGGIFNDARVNVHAMEGRSFLRATQRTWDIIQIHSNHTSSSVAAGTGAMSPNYLQTSDAYRDYFSHLSDEGVLHINHFGFARMITTAALAWRQMGRVDFQRHVVVFGMATPRDTLPTLMIRMRPWTQAEVDDLAQFFRRATQDEFPFKLLQDPFNPTASFLSPEFFSGVVSDHLMAATDTQIRPTTDNQPFFNFLRKRIGPIHADASTFTDPATAYLLNSQLRRNLIPMDLVHLIVTAAVSLFFAAIFVAAPLYKSDIRRAGTTVKFASMLYFSCLGAGFILFELVFIQVFMKLIGYPVYTYVLVIFTLLLGAATGSASSQRMGIHPGARWSWPFAGVFVYGTAFTVAHPVIFNYFLAASDAVRLIVAAALIFPLGFFLGMPFPLGILVAERHSPAAVAWAWGLNGLFTVVGSLACVLLGIAVGFQVTMLIAVGIYIVAFLAFARLRATCVETAEVPARAYGDLRYAEGVQR
jgi:spermidine synthase